MVRRRMSWVGTVAKLIEVTRGIYTGVDVDVVDFDCVHALIVSVADRRTAGAPRHVLERAALSAAPLSVARLHLCLQSQERIDAATLSLEMP